MCPKGQKAGPLARQFSISVATVSVILALFVGNFKKLGISSKILGDLRLGKAFIRSAALSIS
jgi:hypothetical protein